ncbi:hypothetical protein CKM354_000291600 [Cercospora kikuchii]|uniref:UBZ4-type domain-containing protein n=1 Tax=Cercospora kikuchii TaxID=84275 RepID=A0A9P3CGM5_9PEZI|nr:uncharacterized protein CKM354_000291600 [Cercospora kikuchii]GIZ39535.1 hypothetical protein CKM354_000291600 [Cercospora kikuchii]
MQRPRNRQPRAAHDNARRGDRGGGGRRGGRGGRDGHRGPEYHPVPSIQQVVPGAAVSIVLKADQPTGREVQGIVQDVLTRGDHPRGVKVRLTDGRVGRVQRMSASVPSTTTTTTTTSTSSDGFKHVADVRYDDGYIDSAAGPPPRTLADYLPNFDEPQSATGQRTEPSLSSVNATCPVCGVFEGDEVAVSRHVESHFTDAPCG